MQNILKKVVAIICALCLLNGQMSAAGIDDNIEIPLSFIYAYKAKKNNSDEYRRGYYNIYYEYFNNFEDPVVGSGKYTGVFKANDKEKYLFYDKFVAQNIRDTACNNLRNFTFILGTENSESFRNRTYNIDKAVQDVLSKIDTTSIVLEIHSLLNNYEDLLMEFVDVDGEVKKIVNKYITPKINALLIKKLGLNQSVEDFVINNIKKLLIAFIKNGAKGFSKANKITLELEIQAAVISAIQGVKIGASLYGLGATSMAQIKRYFTEQDIVLLTQYTNNNCMQNNDVRLSGNAYLHAMNYGYVSSQIIKPKPFIKYEKCNGSKKSGECGKFIRYFNINGNTANNGLDYIREKYYQRYTVNGIQMILLSPGHLSIPSQYYETYNEVYNNHPNALSIKSQTFNNSLSLKSATSIALAYFPKKQDIINKWKEELVNKKWTDYITSESAARLFSRLGNNCFDTKNIHYKGSLNKFYITGIGVPNITSNEVSKGACIFLDYENKKKFDNDIFKDSYGNKMSSNLREIDINGNYKISRFEFFRAMNKLHQVKIGN